MITELVCYKCKCSKCNHLWTTKGHELPKACPNPKCKRITWNDDVDFSKSPVSVPSVEPIQAPIIEKKSVLNALQAKIDAIQSGVSTPVVEEIDQWQGWGKEEQTYDDQTGDMRTYRKHIKTGKVRWLDSETALISV